MPGLLPVEETKAPGYNSLVTQLPNITTRYSVRESTKHLKVGER